MTVRRIAQGWAVILALTSPASSQSSSTINSSPESSGIPLCNTSISSANASGIFTFPVDYPLETNSTRDGDTVRNIPDPSWAVTVSGGNGKPVRRDYWYDTAGQDYADDLAINYDVCAFTFRNFPLNTIRLGQADSGNCSTMFSERCIESLTLAASRSAHMWVSYSTPPPYENLTAGVLPTICSYIYSDIQDTMANECGQEFGKSESDSTVGARTLMQALTGYNDSTLYNNGCTLTAGNKTLRSASSAGLAPGSEAALGSDAGYDNSTQDVAAMLTVYMPVANMQRRSVMSYASSALRCLRPTVFSENSRVPLALEEGTPWPKAGGGGLSAGAKGGVAAGVVVFVVVVSGLVFCLWLVRRRKRARAAEAAAVAAQGDDESKDLPPEADGANGVHELKSEDRKMELDGVSVAELGGGSGRPVEVEGLAKPVELPADGDGGLDRRRGT